MIVLYDDVKKASWEFLEETALAKLLTYLNTKEPKLIKFLHSFWGAQQRAITYKELRQAIMRGYLSEEILNEWRQDYSRFVVTHVAPMWKDAMEAANHPIERYNTIWRYNPDKPEIIEWTNKNAARFVTRSTNDQISAFFLGSSTARYHIQRA